MLLVVAVLALVANPPGALADAPNMASGNGITVSGTRWISARTLEVDISTPKVAAAAINGPNRVRITFPSDYFQQPTTRYPVLYLLHGGSGGNSAQWTTGGGDEEAITAGSPLITVMPDGGKVGWYTNWVEQSQGAQNWEDFHLNQLIPWIDANLRTIASKSGRAIAGLSMGGFGAVRYAQDRPDLFAYVASFSGAVDLGEWKSSSSPSGYGDFQNYGTRGVIGEQAMQNGFDPYGPFGNPFPPLDTTYDAVNPVNRAARLQGVGVGLWVGSGSNPFDVLEGTMAKATAKFDRALTAAGVPHFYWNYGVPGQSAPYGCDGGHNFGCWNFALHDALPRILDALQKP